MHGSGIVFDRQAGTDQVFVGLIEICRPITVVTGFTPIFKLAAKRNRFTAGKRLIRVIDYRC